MGHIFSKLKDSIKSFFHYLRYDIWHLDKNDVQGKNMFFINLIKAFILTYRNINTSLLSTRASALTYSTLLSIVPLLAVLFGIASGFGFQDLVKGQLFTFFAGQEEVIERSMTYIQKSIQYAHEGLFLGIGLLLLFYTVISLMMDIESAFNKGWGIDTGRSIYRMFTDYLALLIIAPIFLVCNAGLTIFLSTIDLGIISYVTTPFLKVVPFGITILMFTFLLLYIPNTKVKFSAALLGGIFTGCGFQIFQMLYIGGQIWISKYNAIYGSFAALPLLLLWLQLTWLLTLIGVELSFAYQNIYKYSYEYETKNISERYKDFVMLMITSLVVKKFEKGSSCTADEISEVYKIPTKLNADCLNYLKKVGLIKQVILSNDQKYAYVPSTDISKITVSYFFSKIKTFGSENFPIDTSMEFKKEWLLMVEISDLAKSKEGKILLKDL